MKFDEADLDDPDLEAELRECGWESSGEEDVQPSTSARPPSPPLAPPPPQPVNSNPLESTETAEKEVEEAEAKAGWALDPQGEVTRLKSEAVEASKAGNKTLAIHLLRRAKSLQALVDRNNTTNPNPPSSNAAKAVPPSTKVTPPATDKKGASNNQGGSLGGKVAHEKQGVDKDVPFTHPSYELAAQVRFLKFLKFFSNFIIY